MDGQEQGTYGKICDEQEGYETMASTEKPGTMPAKNAPDMNTVISDNLKNLRQSLRLSLSEVSERTGVSKSMLGQIERNESSPTVSTLWKIATGLQVSFTSLMERHEQGIRIVHESEMTPVINDHGRFRLYPVVPIRADRTFELVDLELERGAVSDSYPHAEGTEEIVLVYQGELEILLGEKKEERYSVPQGSVISYQADQFHTYRNLSSGVTRAAMIINYAAKQPSKKGL